ncbi:MAG: hypothetical protein M3O55_09115, partial [Actinomycetota bacterium]|nr:hypothetical protein [Actinomycetota bacterium]
MTARRRLLLAAAGAAGTGSLLAGARTIPGCTGQWLERPNFRGQPVSLVGGPALALAASVTAWAGAPRSRLGRAALLVGLAAGALGAYDDIAGARPGQRSDKGFRGHLSAAAQGRLSAGAVKAA